MRIKLVPTRIPAVISNKCGKNILRTRVSPDFCFIQHTLKIPYNSLLSALIIKNKPIC